MKGLGLTPASDFMAAQLKKKSLASVPVGQLGERHVSNEINHKSP
jgi:hypothetical protein